MIDPVSAIGMATAAYRGLKSAIDTGKELSDMAVKYQERIAFATMRASIPDWQPPKDWDTLSNAEKHKRLKKLKSV